MTQELSTLPSDHERTRDEILSAAAAVFRIHGFKAGTTAEIAARCGLSQGSIYHYVGSKQELLDEIVLTLGDELEEVTTAAGDLQGPPQSRLRFFITEMTRVIARRTDAFALYWLEGRSMSDESRQRIRRQQSDCLRQVAGFVEELQASGLVAAGPPNVVTEAIMGMVSWLQYWYDSSDGMPPEDIAATFCRLIGIESDIPARAPTARGIPLS